MLLTILFITITTGIFFWLNYNLTKILAQQIQYNIGNIETIFIIALIFTLLSNYIPIIYWASFYIFLFIIFSHIRK